VKENAGLAFHMGRRDDRFESIFFEMVETLVCAVEALYKRPLHGGHGGLRNGFLIAQMLPVVGKGATRIDDISLLDAQSIYVTDYSSDVLCGSVSAANSIRSGLAGRANFYTDGISRLGRKMMSA
jgi:hypothetical protein